MPNMIDIIIVVHNSLHHIKACLESIAAGTQVPHHIFIWDNASDQPTAAYLASLREQNITVHRHYSNDGDVWPNNRLAQMGTGRYIVCLNSDTLVFPGWDAEVVGALDDGYIQAGWGGAKLNCGIGYPADDNIDYLEGFGFGIRRETINTYGFLDEAIYFAYTQDADLSLRLTAAGGKLKALRSGLVKHIGQGTVTTVPPEVKAKLDAAWRFNLARLRARWGLDHPVTHL